MTSASRIVPWLGLVLASLPASACEEEQVSTNAPGEVSAVVSAPARAPTASASAITSPPKQELLDEHFVESELMRDPFRPFDELFAARATGRAQTQRTVVLADYAVDELKLIGIVSRINPAKAMLVDPRGQGHVVHRGDFVGRAERVQGGTTDAEFELNWRVERIRDSDLVLVREDPSNPDVPSATRVIALRADESLQP